MKQPGDEFVIQETIAHYCFVSLKNNHYYFLMELMISKFN